jgi:gentisate 1,2-dioxygenase
MTPLAARARYHAADNVFTAPLPPVPVYLSIAERDAAFSPACPTGPVAIDLSTSFGAPFPATTPLLLARYLVVRPGEVLRTSFKAAGEIHYVIQGSGTTFAAADQVAWCTGDVFCLPGGRETSHRAENAAILLSVTDEPALAFIGARAVTAPENPVPTVLYRNDEVMQRLHRLYEGASGTDAAGKGVIFTSDSMERLRTTISTTVASMNSLLAGGDQRPHRHNAAALTLCIASEGCHSLVDGQRVDWQPFALMVTPPGAVHSHHNRGPDLMRSLVVQDGGFHYHARTVGFEFVDSP